MFSNILLHFYFRRSHDLSQDIILGGMSYFLLKKNAI